ncbi:MAG TPA: RNA-binding S4 domain-containing protein [Steroidobacteraceae bacterium]|nr:RNA-binding S4 domain-containing protein [Steroidobacteraceae bacterium]
MCEPADAHPGAARIDRWLFAVRLIGSRALATAAVRGGRVHVNGERVKPAHALRAGDRVSFMRGALEFECTVASVPPRRGPARAATLCYAETPASRARGAQFTARMKLAAALTPRPDTRPQKHERRRLRRLRGRI